MECLNDGNYQQKIAHGNVVVKFTADWCRPCEALQPVIDRLQEVWRSKVNFYAVDVDKTSVAGATGVTGIPTLIFYKGGIPVRRLVGVHDFGKLNKLLSEMYG